VGLQKMIHKISVENIKCGGCASTIEKKLKKNSYVKSVDIDIESGNVQFEIDDMEANEKNIANLNTQLTSLGYPEVGSVDGLKSKTAKAKSFISCAIGKVNNKIG
tara:strand:- start:1020 stop:1334 length:315 start_codon:yes stop_codon:yes gene_type:complete